MAIASPLNPVVRRTRRPTNGPGLTGQGLIPPSSQPMPQVSQGGLMNNTGAQAAYGVTGQMPGKTAGGLFGAPLGNYDPAQRLSPQGVVDQARGNPFAPTGATPLGSMAMDQGGLNSKLMAGQGLGGGVAVRDPNGQVRLQFEAPREFGPQRLNPGDTGYLRPDSQQRDRASAALASNQASTPDRDAYKARNAFRKELMTPEGRIAGRGNAYELAQNRKESRQLNRGVMSFEQRLSAADPRADAQRKLGEGQIGLAKSQMDQRAQESKDRIALGDRQISSQDLRAKIAANEKAREDSPDGELPFPEVMSGSQPGPLAPKIPGVTGVPLTRKEGIAIIETAQNDPESAKAALIARGATRQQADKAVRSLNPDYGKPNLGQKIVGSQFGSAMRDYFGGRAAAAAAGLFGIGAKPNGKVTAKKWTEEDRAAFRKKYGRDPE